VGVCVCVGGGGVIEGTHWGGGVSAMRGGPEDWQAMPGLGLASELPLRPGCFIKLASHPESLLHHVIQPTLYVGCM
jgi:hypothetical protein